MNIDNKTREQLVYELTELHSENDALKESIKSSISCELAAQEARRYAESILETVREPLLVLDENLKIISANPNFYRIFKVTPGETLGSFIYNLGNKQWDIPKLRELLETILPQKATFDNYEVEHDFSAIGRRIMLLNARQIQRVLGKERIILLAIEDITERRELEESHNKKQSVERMRKALGATLRAITVTVETRDPYTAGHQRRVADLARAVATEMNFPADMVDGIRIAATIHDLGKICVPVEILSKPTKLSVIEFSLIKAHSQCGYDILKDIDFPWPIARIILEHHERLDGSGYPNGVTGEKLLMESRILAVADVVESMASHRPYRPGMGINVALEEIEKNKKTLYDADVVDACLRLFREQNYKFEEI